MEHLCRHCEDLPAIPESDRGLCVICNDQFCIRRLYRTKYTPDKEKHILQLRRRASQRLPLFQEASHAG
jgi:hypothetical protein